MFLFILGFKVDLKLQIGWKEEVKLPMENGSLYSRNEIWKAVTWSFLKYRVFLPYTVHLLIGLCRFKNC